MLEIKINNDVFQLPQSYREITLLQYCEIFYDLIDNPEYEERITFLNEIKILSRLLGVDEAYIKDLPLKMVNDLSDKIRWVYNDSDFRDGKENKITLNGVNYYIPNVDQQTTRQWIDSDISLNEKDNPYKFLELLSCLLVKEGEEKYDGGWAERVEPLKSIPAEQALNLLYFFFFRGENLRRITEAYSLMEEATPQLAQHTEGLLKKIIGNI